ncbi:MAG: CoA transferase [Dehalococcoidia bacterium]
MAKQVFEGLKVVDFSWAAAGPQVSRELAEHGATVIRVESHSRPCPLRTFAPHKDSRPGIDRSAFYAAYNTNKYNMSLDLTHPKAKEVTRRLISWADVTGESMTPGTMGRLGLDYQSCRDINPGIIYFSTTQQGQYGPHKAFQGVGHHINALAGFSACTGWPESEPTMVFTAYSDYIAPWYTLIAIMGALLKRRKTGEGMYIEQSQLEAGLTFAAPHILDFMVNKRNTKRRGNSDTEICPHGIFRCMGTDRWVAITVPGEEKWKAFCEVIARPELIEDKRFNTFQNRKNNEIELNEIISAWTSQHPHDYIVSIMQERGIPSGTVQTSEDLLNDPQLMYRQHFHQLEHEEIGTHSYHAPAYRLSKTPCEIRRAAPRLGQDNEYVYRDILGFSEDAIADMIVEGIITTESGAITSSW